MIRSKLRSVVMTVIVEGVKGTGVLGVSRASQRCCTVSNFPVSKIRESRWWVAAGRRVEAPSFSGGTYVQSFC